MLGQYIFTVGTKIDNVEWQNRKLAGIQGIIIDNIVISIFIQLKYSEENNDRQVLIRVCKFWAFRLRYFYSTYRCVIFFQGANKTIFSLEEFGFEPYLLTWYKF